jgi:hypothetical protein
VVQETARRAQSEPADEAGDRGEVGTMLIGSGQPEALQLIAETML